MSMAGLIAFFVAVASGEVLVRLAVDDNVRHETAQVILPAAWTGFGLSIASIAVLLVAAGIRRHDAPSRA
jgi:hypothetical protein